MTDEQLELLIQRTVSNAVQDFVAKGRSMPSTGHADQVTEITIRCGSTEGVQVLAASGGTPCIPRRPCCGAPPSLLPGVHSSVDLPLDEASKSLLEQIQETTQEDLDELIRKLGLRIQAKQMAKAIRELAGELGIESE